MIVIVIKYVVIDRRRRIFHSGLLISFWLSSPLCQPCFYRSRALDQFVFFRLPYFRSEMNNRVLNIQNASENSALIYAILYRISVSLI